MVPAAPELRKGQTSSLDRRSERRQAQCWAADLDARLADHEAGRGARLTAVV